MKRAKQTLYIDILYINLLMRYLKRFSLYGDGERKKYLGIQYEEILRESK